MASAMRSSYVRHFLCGVGMLGILFAMVATIDKASFIGSIDCTESLCMVRHMPSKTISLETDAYKRLKATKRTGESFSAVVRRITPPVPKATAADLLADMKSGKFGRGLNWTAVKGAVGRRSRSRVTA